MSTEPLARDADAPVDLTLEVGAAFKSAMASVRRRKGRETHRPGELSYAQYGLLFGLADGEAKSARELAEASELTAATVTPMLDALSALGLIVRERSAHDRRIVLNTLTPEGEAVLAERRARYEPQWRAALEEFDAAELAATAAVLRRLSVLFDEF